MNEKKKPKVLLVEDEITLSMIIKETMENEGFDVTNVPDGVKGLRSFHDWKPDVIIADIMMPEMDGFEMVKRIRKIDEVTPVLFLTARSTLDDLVAGFHIGANDYLKKPFKMRELIVRVKSLLYRAMPRETDKEEYDIGKYHFNTTTQTLSYKGVDQELSYLENEVLKYLCGNLNKVVEVRDLLRDLWHDDSNYNRNSLHGFIYKLRKRLAADKQVKIVNIRGIGYKLIVIQWHKKTIKQ
ncbi:MAG: response regulator transcription factor [Tannerellaceae bacterium]|jgi:DNA-binding response OmpR family regulator|nr:response regulator transcription factor [Tannerellaceae bacterium]